MWITQDDIDNGERNNPEKCPTALALTRELGICIIVGFTRAKSKTLQYTLPDSVQIFITNYDDGRDVTPIQFDTPKGIIPSEDTIQLFDLAEYAHLGENAHVTDNE